MFRLVLLVSAVVCAVYGVPSERIHAGSEAAIGDVPFQVSIQTPEGIHHCGGVIVGPFKVLSTVSCLRDIKVKEGTVRTGTITLDGGVAYNVKEYFPNPNFFVNDEGIPENDIAVLLLDSEIVFDEATGRAFMPFQDSATPAGLVCSISGWGTLTFGGGTSSTLQVAQVNVVDNAACVAEYEGTLTVPSNVVCAKNEETKADACDRDNGGPLFSDGIVYGVFSLGGRCGSSDRSGFYTQISAFRDWIDSQN